MKTLAFSILAGVMAATAANAEHHEGDHKKTAKAMETPELTGFFTADDWTATFLPAGYVVIADKATGAAGFIVKYGAKDGVLWFKNLTAPANADAEGAKCSVENKGKYNYTLDGDALSFTLIEDACPGRVEAVESAALTRAAMPAREESE